MQVASYSFYVAMDLLRGNGNFDQLKRDLFAPLCIGLPGLGKSRFERIAAVFLIQKATGVTSPTLVQSHPLQKLKIFGRMTGLMMRCCVRYSSRRMKTEILG